MKTEESFNSWSKAYAMVRESLSKYLSSEEAEEHVNIFISCPFRAVSLAQSLEGNY
jgi:hypothetical protein